MMTYVSNNNSELSLILYWLQTAVDAAAAIKQWIQTFRNFAGNDIYIGGETYAGVLVPLISQQIVNGISVSLNIS